MFVIIFNQLMKMLVILILAFICYKLKIFDQCRITASIWCSRRMPTPIIWMPHWISVLSCSTSPPSPPGGRGRYAGNFHLLRPTACRKDFAPLRCTICNDSGASKATVKCAIVDPRLSVCSIRKDEPIRQNLSEENRRYFYMAIQTVTDAIRYVGVDDNTLALFENQYPVQPMGVS